MKTIEVVAAVIQHDNKTLCVKRGPSKFEYVAHKYEFPGGKIEVGETKEEAMVREIQEELNLDLTSLKFFMTVHHTYPDFKLIMHSFICPTSTREITLTEHTDAKWLSIGELDDLDWAGADIPIVKKLQAAK
ncbi:(deoxy)nucleoside triphosphate pyrophosphohydrolase [Fibrobacterales bacterium]|nr:(deoxy)nucleoside triphosphate pyrophosphohydrolase [Fibrobacterales bacterium]